MIFDDIDIGTHKPPLGIMPKWLWIEKVNSDRINQLKDAIRRYLDSNHCVPIEWINELNELIKNEVNSR